MQIFNDKQVFFQSKEFIETFFNIYIKKLSELDFR